MKRFILRFGVSLIALSLGVVTSFVWKTINPWDGSAGRNPSESLSLHLQETTTFKIREAPRVQLTITNTGSETVTLVLPGDGSWSGARTPSVGWSIVPVDERAQIAAMQGLEITRIGCGNMDPLRWKEIFTLAPGETKTFKASLPWFRSPGVYRLAFHYANSPQLGWGTAQLEYQNPFAIWRALHSTECSLVSNEIVVTVTE